MDVEIDGKPFWINGIVGTVQGLQKWNETIVRKTGDASAHHDGLGNIIVRDSSISSENIQKQEFWIVSSGGREMKVTGNYAFREGQQALLIWGNVEPDQTGKYLIIENLTPGAKQRWNIRDGIPKSVARKGILRLNVTYWGIFILICVIGFIMNVTSYGVCVGRNNFNEIKSSCDQSSGISLFLLFAMMPVFYGLYQLIKALYDNQKGFFISINRHVDININSNPEFVKELEV